MFTSTTLPRKAASVWLTTFPCTSGKLNWNGSSGFFMRVCSAGSVGAPMPAAPGVVARAATRAVWPFCESASVPSAFGVTSRRSGRAPEK